MAIVLGKVLGGTILAFGQGLIFLLLAPTVGIKLSLASLALAMLLMFIIAFGLTALGVCIAWRMSSTQGFHAIMNLFLMPMWFLSGALFPASGAWKGLKWIMYLNPLTYGLAGLRRAMYLGQQAGEQGAGIGLPVALGVSVLFAAAMFGLAIVIVGGRVQADLQ